ncbi:hypothetical protein T484DRAFT_1886272 [Baffinella frigidus]|nr:hypothetical protein T484DRAFT_1886272 [Cryptophyta sp. CCMP2293]
MVRLSVLLAFGLSVVGNALVSAAGKAPAAAAAGASSLASVRHGTVKQQLVEAKPLSIAQLSNNAAKQTQDMVNIDKEGELPSSKAHAVESDKDLEKSAASEEGQMESMDDGQRVIHGASSADSDAVKQAYAREAKIEAAIPSASQSASEDSEAVKQAEAEAHEDEIKAATPTAATPGARADSDAVKQAEADEAKIDGAHPSASVDTNDSDDLLKDAMASEHKEEAAYSEFKMGGKKSPMEALQKRSAAEQDKEANQVKSQVEVDGRAHGRARLQHSLANSIKDLAVDQTNSKLPSDVDKLLQQALGSQRQDEAEVDGVTQQRGRKGQEADDAQGTQTLAVDKDHGKVPKSVLSEAKQLAMARGDNVDAEFAGERHAAGGAGSAPKRVAPRGGAKLDKSLQALAKEARESMSGDEGADQSYFRAEKVRAGQQTLSQGPWLPKGHGLLKLARQAMRSQDAETKAGKAPVAGVAGAVGVVGAVGSSPQGKASALLGGKGAGVQSGVAVRA